MRGDPQLHNFQAEKTCIIAVDPLHDFVDTEGLFARQWPDDIGTLQKIIPTIEDIARAYHERVTLMLCTSSYRVGQFNDEHPGLTTLCTTPKGREYRIKPEVLPLFDRSITKTRNSVLSDPSIGRALHKKNRLYDNIWLIGLTTTSCIRHTIRECRDHKQWQDINIIIAKDAVAARRSEHIREAKLLSQWSHRDADHLYVFDSWRDVPIVSEQSSKSQ